MHAGEVGRAGRRGDLAAVQVDRAEDRPCVARQVRAEDDRAVRGDVGMRGAAPLRGQRRELPEARPVRRDREQVQSAAGDAVQRPEHDDAAVRRPRRGLREPATAQQLSTARRRVRQLDDRERHVLHLRVHSRAGQLDHLQHDECPIRRPALPRIEMGRLRLHDDAGRTGGHVRLLQRADRRAVGGGSHPAEQDRPSVGRPGGIVQVPAIALAGGQGACVAAVDIHDPQVLAVALGEREHQPRAVGGPVGVRLVAALEVLGGAVKAGPVGPHQRDRRPVPELLEHDPGLVGADDPRGRGLGGRDSGTGWDACEGERDPQGDGATRRERDPDHDRTSAWRRRRASFMRD